MKTSAGCLCFSDESGESMSDIAIASLNGKGQVFSVEMSIFRQEAEKPRPLIGDEGTTSRVYFLDKSPCATIATRTQLPSKRLTRYAINGPPDPNFLFFPFTKCQSSSIITISELEILG